MGAPSGAGSVAVAPIGAGKAVGAPTGARATIGRAQALVGAVLRGQAGAARAAPSGPTFVSMVAFGGGSPHVSPVFARMVPLERAGLGAGLDAWWEAGPKTKAGRMMVQRRVHLGRPAGKVSTGWIMTGRVWRFLPPHWVPLVVELWPVHEKYTKITMTPQARVLVSRRYFRLGHSVLDRLSADLAQPASPPGLELAS